MRFNARFFQVVRDTPLAVEPFSWGSWSDAVRIHGELYRLSYDARTEDSRGRALAYPQSLVRIARWSNGAECAMGYRRSPGEPPAKRPLDPSFDCHFPRGRLQRFICAGNHVPDVGSEDYITDKAYTSALAHAPDKAALRRGQTRWLAGLAAACAAPAKMRGLGVHQQRQIDLCLVERYRAQRGALEALAGQPDATAAYVARVGVAEALFMAAADGDVGHVRRLLAAGGDPNREPPTRRNGETPLTVALSLDNRAAADMLMTHGGSIFLARDDIPLLIRAVMTRRPDLARVVLASCILTLHATVNAHWKGAPPYADTALGVAIERDDAPMVALLLRAGAEPSDPEAVHDALMIAHDPALTRLLRRQLRR
jgi:hypothetical protein